MDTSTELGTQVPAEPLRALVSAFGTAKQAAEALGISGSTVSRYLRTGQCPLVVALAAQAKLSRPRVLVLSGPTEKIATLLPIITALGLSFQEITE